MNTPVPPIRLYLDVDGVINAQMPMGWGRLQNGHARADGVEYRIRWAPNMLKALGELDFLEIVWCTTWRSDAADSLAKITGFGSNFRVLHPLSGVTTFPSIDWKVEAIQADQIENPSAFVWIDDEISESERIIAGAFGGHTITTNPLLGITPTHLAEIENLREREVKAWAWMDLSAELAEYED